MSIGTFGLYFYKSDNYEHLTEVSPEETTKTSLNDPDPEEETEVSRFCCLWINRVSQTQPLLRYGGDQLVWLR